MSTCFSRRPRRACAVMVAVALLSVSCRPSDVLSVPPPVGVLQMANNAAGAEAELAGALSTLNVYAAGPPTSLFELSGLLTDEFTYVSFTSPSIGLVAPDARNGAIGSLAQTGPASGALNGLLSSRLRLLLAEAAVAQFEPASGHVGLAYALTGYSELWVAESFCAGVPFSTILPGGGWAYGAPLSTDSMFGAAEAHFDSALKYAASNDTVISLASVGLGRVRVGRGDFRGADSAVAGVPLGFVYGLYSSSTTSNVSNQLNLWSSETATNSCSPFNVADIEGGNGMNFVSGGDARLAFNTAVVLKTCDGETWYYPAKFGLPSTTIPIATGVEAQLVAIEAELQGGNVTGAMADLNTLRSNAPSTYLKLAVGALPLMQTGLVIDSLNPPMDSAVSILFRERAFWLYGLGTRLGDMRRLIRQYHRDPETVFPTGTYVGGESPKLSPPIPSYGTDVSFMIPTPSAGRTPNPGYQGCLSPPSTA